MAATFLQAAMSCNTLIKAFMKDRGAERNKIICHRPSDRDPIPTTK